MGATPATVAQWKRWRARKQVRREVATLVANVCAAQVLLLVFAAQCYRGWFSHHWWAPDAVRASLVAAGLVAVASVAFPVQVGSMLGLVLRASGQVVVRVITVVALVVVWVAAWLPARVFGRRQLVQRHRTARSWFAASSGWRCSTWVPKVSEADAADQRSRSTLLRLFAYFVARRKLLLLLVTFATLIAVSVSVFAQTPYLSPFVYSFF